MYVHGNDLEKTNLFDPCFDLGFEELRCVLVISIVEENSKITTYRISLERRATMRATRLANSNRIAFKISTEVDKGDN